MAVEKLKINYKTQKNTWPYPQIKTIISATNSDDDLLWNGSEEVGNVRSECEEDEGTDCEVGDSDTDW
jgi:hypothetical protein